MTLPVSELDRDEETVPLPSISYDEPFGKIVKKLSIYIVDAITMPSTFEQLRITSAGNGIRTLVDHLVLNVSNPAIVNALLTLKWHFSTLEPDDRGLHETRATACEIVAWRFLTRLSERDAIRFALYELPHPETPEPQQEGSSNANGRYTGDLDEHSRLLAHSRPREPVPPSPVRPNSRRQQLIRTVTHLGAAVSTNEQDAGDDEEDPSSSFTGLNALEIAGVADAKKFLSQDLVQKIIFGIWTGEIILWESLSVYTKKNPQFYNKRKADPFSRLRVPKYIKVFEVLFFAIFLTLYYAVLVERDPYKITPLETILYVWVAAFAYDELSEFLDAGLFYYTDFWSSWDIAIIFVGVASLTTRIVGLIRGSNKIIDLAFDILSLEALFLVPRTFSLLSLHQYFGTLIPCLKEMAKEFLKFMTVIAILYVGFLTTFVFLARHRFTASQMSWILVKVFFGSNYLGFDVMNKISPLFGPPLMLIFITMTTILLVTSLISILSNSFSKVTARSREEYLYVYSVYVLEASTSNRLTHFYPPLNLIPLIFIRPLRLFVPAEKLRSIRIILLKTTHTPIIAGIWLYETVHERIYGVNHTFASHGPRAPDMARVPRPFLVNRTSMQSAAQRFSTFSLNVDTASPSSKSRGRKDGGLTGTEALEEKVADLTAKINELTALITAQQQDES